MHIESIELRNYRVFRRAELAAAFRTCDGCWGEWLRQVHPVGCLQLPERSARRERGCRRGPARRVSGTGQPGGNRAHRHHHEVSGERWPTCYLPARNRGPGRAGRGAAGSPPLPGAARRGSRGISWTSAAVREPRSRTSPPMDRRGRPKSARSTRWKTRACWPSRGLGQFREFRVVSEFRTLIENWYISDFHIADARPSAEAGFAEHLSTRGRQRGAGRPIPLRQPSADLRSHPRSDAPAGSRCREGGSEAHGGWTPGAPLSGWSLPGSVHRPLPLGRNDQDVRLSRLAPRSEAPSLPRGRRTREPALPGTPAGARRGVPRLRTAWRAGIHRHSTRRISSTVRHSTRSSGW